MKFSDNKKLGEKGFTLVEVMVAVLILSIGLVGSLTLIDRSLRNVSFEENRIIATGLVEDGMERLRNVRDTNWLAGNTWDAGIDGSEDKAFIKFFCGDNTVADISNPDPTSIDNCVSSGNCKVFSYTADSLNPDDPFRCYGDDFSATYSTYTGVQYSDFYRLIHIDENSGDVDSNKVTITVRWNEGGKNRYLTVEEIIYNWK